MALFFVPGRGLVDDQEEGASIPTYGELTLPNGEKITWGDQGVYEVPTYANTAQYGDLRYQWLPGQMGERDIPFEQAAPGYLPELLQLRERLRTGQASDWDREWYQRQVAEAQAIPTRDIGSLQAGWGEGAERWNYLNTTSPDLGAIMLSLADKIDAGSATEQERQLFDETRRQAEEQNYRASVPQESDRFNPLSNEFFMALGALGGAAGGAGAFGAFAPVAGAAGGGAAAGAAAPSLLGIPTSTLGTLGAIGSYGGTGAGLLGRLTGQDWLSKLGLGLGVAGGLAGGLAGLGNVLGTGVRSVGDVARLASSAGKLTGALGRASGVQPLQQASRYLGLGSQVGSLGGGALGLLGAAQGVQQGATQAATQAVTDTGGQRMADFSYDDFLGWGGDETQQPWYDWATQASADDPALAQFLGWGGDETQMPWYQGADLDTSGGGGGWLGSVLGGLGSVGGFLGKNAGVLGPAASALGSLGGGLLGSRASSDAAGLQAAALNRGLDLSTAQWLAQQERSAPWVEAGRAALGQLQGVAGQAAPTYQQPGLPGTQPFQYSGPGMPGTGFQYTGAGMPATGFQYTNQFPMQDFKAPTWDELKARDPGIAARLTEAQQGLEASAAARGSALSGPALAALQRQSQTLASQEYDPAYRRALGEYQMGYGEDWQQQQEAYQRALAQNQQLYGRQYQQQADIYGRQLGENQQLYQRGYQQQGDIYGRQLAENQLGYNRQWQQQMTDYERQLAQNQLLYGRGMEQYKQGYGEQLGLNQQDYARNQALYGQQYQQMVDAYNAQRLAQQTQFNQLSNISGLGQTTIGQLGTQGAANTQQMANLYGQLGSAQAIGQLGSAYNLNQAIGGGTSALQNLLKGLSA